MPQTHYANTVLYAVSPVASPPLLYNTRALSGPPPDPRRGLWHCRRVGVLLASEEAAVAHTHRLRQPDGRQRPSVLGTVLHCTHKHIPPISPEQPPIAIVPRQKPTHLADDEAAAPAVVLVPALVSLAARGGRGQWRLEPCAAAVARLRLVKALPRRRVLLPPTKPTTTHQPTPHCHINAPSASTV